MPKHMVKKNQTKIIKTRDFNHVYCYLNNITIEGELYACPPVPFKLDTTVNFETKEGGHSVTFVKLKGDSQLVVDKLPYFNSTINDQDFTDVNNYIMKLNRLNEELEEMRTKSALS